MNESGFVSLVQFQPDAARLEVVNVGLVLFGATSQRLEVKMAQGIGRVHRFFGKEVDSDFLRDMKHAFESRIRAESDSIKSREDLASFASRLGNDLILTNPRGLAITQDFHETLSDLFQRWVDEPKRRTTKHSALTRRLKSFFDRLPDQERIRRHEVIQLPEIDSVEVPYAYLNGKLNLVKPIGLGEKSEDETRSWLFIMRLLAESSHPSPGVDVIIARADSSDEHERRTYCERVLARSGANLFAEEKLEEFENHVGRALFHN